MHGLIRTCLAAEGEAADGVYTYEGHICGPYYNSLSYFISVVTCRDMQRVRTERSDVLTRAITSHYYINLYHMPSD